MNGTQTATRHAKPPPAGPAPQAPTHHLTPASTSSATHAHAHTQTHQHPPSTPTAGVSKTNGPVNGVHANHTTGTTNASQKGKKKNADQPPLVDPSQIYETLKNRIAALEEDAVHEEEEERRFAEKAQASVQGMSETAIHAKYIELFAELKRLEREHAKDKQKLVKDKDAAKGQLTKANQAKTKMENLARELQKDNKLLREDSKRLALCVEEAQEEIMQMKTDMAKRAERAKIQDMKYREMPDIVVKVNCKYRAELFFKISRKTKLSRLFNAWTERMELGTVPGGMNVAGVGGNLSNAKKGSGTNAIIGSGAISAGGSTQINGSEKPTGSIQFLFTHAGRMLEADQTPEESGIEDGDEIVAVEMMDLTDGLDTEDPVDQPEPMRQKLKKNWTDNPREARKAIEDIFGGVVRERLKGVLRQYELRERHFECVVRSKELEVLLSRARAAEQKQLAEGEKLRADKAEVESQQLRKELEGAQNGQALLIDKLIACCKEPNAERTQRLFTSLREELERRGTKLADGPVGG